MTLIDKRGKLQPPKVRLIRIGPRKDFKYMSDKAYDYLKSREGRRLTVHSVTYVHNSLFSLTVDVPTDGDTIECTSLFYDKDVDLRVL